MTLLALHGFSQAGMALAELAALLERPVVAPDLPGHGGAPLPDPDDALGEAVADLARLLPEGGGPVLGYSMGGRLALHVAARHPDQVTALVVVSAGPGVADPAARAARARNDEALAARIEEIGVAAFLDEWLARPMFAGLARRGPDWVAQDRAVRERNSATGLAASLRLLGQGALPAVDVSRLVMPLLVISGGDDEPYVRGGAAMAAAAPRGEAAVVPGCGHGVVGEDPDAVARLAARFLPRSW